MRRQANKSQCQTYAEMLLESFKKANLTLGPFFLFHFTVSSILWRITELFLGTGRTPFGKQASGGVVEVSWAVGEPRHSYLVIESRSSTLCRPVKLSGPASRSSGSSLFLSSPLHWCLSLSPSLPLSPASLDSFVTVA